MSIFCTVGEGGKVLNDGRSCPLSSLMAIMAWERGHYHFLASPCSVAALAVRSAVA